MAINKSQLIFLTPAMLLLLLFSGVLFHYSFIIFSCIFFVVALGCSCIYGRYAFRIHNIDLSRKDIDNKWYLYNQYWLNGLGAFMGWVALYILIFYRISPIEINHFFPSLEHWTNHLKTPDLILVLVTFLGLTGYFPYVILIGDALKPKV